MFTETGVCCYIRGSKSRGMGMLHLAIALEVFLIVVSERRMYLRKQSLDQRPIPWISYLGHPMAAAVEAAPMRKEWEEMFAAPFVVSFRILFMCVLVRYLPD